MTRLLDERERIHARTVLFAGRIRTHHRRNREHPDRESASPPPPSGKWTPPSALQPAAHRQRRRHRAGADFDERQGDPWQRIGPLANDQRRRSSIDFGYNNGSSSASSTQPAKLLGDLSSSASTQGHGKHRPVRQIQVSVAAVVTRVLPNGNLVISGSQEVRVIYELRQLTVAGIVNPLDISLNNTVAYDRIAEARISYGGRGGRPTFSSRPGDNRSTTPSGHSSRSADVRYPLAARRRRERASRRDP